VLLGVGGDPAGDLGRVGGLGEQAGQALQLTGGELVKGAGEVGLGGVAQQQHDQLARLGVALLQPGAAALGGLLVVELAAVGHRGHLLLLLLAVERVRRSRERRRMRARPLRSCRSS
jgi:hypothetical protein